MNAKRLCLLGVCALMSQLAQGESSNWDSLWADPLKAGQDAANIQAQFTPETPETLAANCAFVKDWSSALSLEDAISLTWCHNPRLKAALADVDMQTALLGEAKAAFWPTASATMGRLRNASQAPGVSGSNQTSMGSTSYANVSWRLFDFGARDASKQSAVWGLVSATASQRAAVRMVLGNVIQQYFDASTAQTAMLARQEAEVIAVATFDLAARREHKGVVSHNDTLQSSAALGKARLARSRAHGELDKAIAMLAYVMGVQNETRMALPQLEPVYAEQHEAINTQVSQMDDIIQAHPMVAAAKAQWEAARQRVDVTRAEGRPTLDAAATYFQNGYPGQGLMADRQRVKTVGLTLSIPIFDGFAQGYKVQAAQAQVEKLAWELENTQRQIGLEVLKARADESTAFDNLSLADALVVAARESLASSKRRYESGAADILEMLNTQAALADAQQERIRSIAEWRAAQLHAWSLSGHLNGNFLKAVR